MRALVLIATTNRRGAEIEGQRLAAELTAAGVQASAKALAAGHTGPQLEVPVLGNAPLAAATLRRLRRLAADHDIVVAYGSSTLPACALSLAGARTPFIYRSIGDPRAWAGGRVRRFRTSLLLARAARTVALWPEAAEALNALYRIPVDKLRVVPNARSSTEFRLPEHAERQEAREALGISKGQLAVAVVGALSPEKRVDLALRSLSLVPNAKVLVAGDGSERVRLEGLVESQPELAARTTFLGAIADVRPVLQASDVLVSTSRTEGMAGTIIEAGLSGIRIVATDVGAAQWMREHGVFSGAVVSRDPTPAEVADAIRALPPVRSAPIVTDACSWLVVVAAWIDTLSELKGVCSPSTMRESA